MYIGQLNIGKPTRTGKDACPLCNAEVDAVTSVEGDAKPKPDDVTICA